jgi:hypothetical protein
MNLNFQNEYLIKLKEEIEIAVRVSDEVLSEFHGDNINYAYAKGSAIKKIETKLDYVPFISDIDIHVSLKNEAFTNDLEGFKNALSLSRRYEDTYNKILPEKIHIPRLQIMYLNQIKQIDEFVDPQESDVKVLQGNPVFNPTKFSKEEIRMKDRNLLLEEEEFLYGFSTTIVDRVGLDYWSALRRMVFRVPPSVIRLLTQESDNPLEIWSKNRTEIAKILKSKYPIIYDDYISYFVSGWQLFESNFSESIKFRNTIYHGYAVIRKSLDNLNKVSLS